MDGKRDLFVCTRCGFAAAVATPGDAPYHLELFRCPLCGRFPSRLAFTLTLLAWGFFVSLPFAFFTLIFTMFAAMDLHLVRTIVPFVVTAVVVAVLIVPAMIHRWRKKHREVAAAVQLRRYWEWRLADGPRIVAAQDPGSGDDAIWVDGIRAAGSEDGDGYLIPLQTASGDPYRGAATQARLVFPADGTCWLSLGGKRIEPVRTSPDVV